MLTSIKKCKLESHINGTIFNLKACCCPSLNTETVIILSFKKTNEFIPYAFGKKGGAAN